MKPKRRRTTAQRGYGYRPEQMRRKYEPGEAWDLGHDDYDRTKYAGPEHARCNWRAPLKMKTSREW